MIDDEPPEIGEVTIGEDFHDLMHPWYACREYGYPAGAWRTHLARVWRYRWHKDLRAQTLCRIGRHRITKAWRRRSVGTPWQMEWICVDCARRASLR